LKAKLYSPVFVDLWEKDEYGGHDGGPAELSQHEATYYLDEIRTAIISQRAPEEAERGLMEYYHEPDSVNKKVLSLLIDVEIHDHKLWAVAALELADALTPEELDTLGEYITGQYSDGWGEDFEQRDIRIDDGELNVHLWKRGGLFIDTQEQFARRLGLELLPDALSRGNEGRRLLNARIQQNWDEYREAPHDTTPETLYTVSVQIIAHRDAFVFMRDYEDFTKEQIDCLLQFADPVDLVADYLSPN